MQVKVPAALLFCVSVVLFVEVLTSRSAGGGGPKSVATGRQAEDPTTLKARVKKVKAKGERKATFGSPIPIYAETSGLDEASSTYTVVVARPREAATLMLSPYKLTTFQKFEILDKLTAPAFKSCCGPKTSDLPPGLTVSGPGEIYVRMNGGRLTIDEVDVTQQFEFEFNPAEEYLLFLMPDETGVVSTLPLGPYGVFKVRGDGLESLLNYPHVLDTEIKSRHGGSLGNVKAKLKATRVAK